MTQSADDISRMLKSARPRRGRWVIGGLLVLVLAGGAGWYALSGTAKTAQVSYLTEAVTKGPLTVTVTATGTVQPTTQVEVSSELSGTLASVDVDYNDTVEVGQVLARLDDTKLRAQLENSEASLVAARARLVSAQATAREAEANFTTQSALDERGIAARSGLITVQANLERAKAAVEIAEADLGQAEASLTLQRADLANAVIRSPIKGIVLNRAAETGQIVAASLSAPVLFTLAEDLRRMDLLVNIDEADIGRVTVGARAVFTVDAYPAEEFPAVITQVRFAPETTDNVVTYKAVLSVENPDGLLRPGMTATATLIVSEVQEALTVPNAALRYAPPKAAASTKSQGLVGLILPGPPGSRGAQPSVATGKSLWVLRAGVPQEVPVTLGDSDGRRTVVTSEALAEGDLVITDQISRSN